MVERFRRNLGHRGKSAERKKLQRPRSEVPCSDHSRAGAGRM